MTLRQLDTSSFVDDSVFLLLLLLLMLAVVAITTAIAACMGKMAYGTWNVTIDKNRHFKSSTFKERDA